MTKLRTPGPSCLLLTHGRKPAGTSDLGFAKTACIVVAFCVAVAIALPAQTFNFKTYRFDGTDGGSPLAGLVQATDGNLYGTTQAGGAIGQGTVFKITPSGTLTKLLSFCYCADGENPQAALIQATDGNLYGTTPYPGGTVFKVTLSGIETVLSSDFAAQIVAPLVQATDGNFYGTTANGNPEGTVFKISPSGTLTTLYAFCSQSGCADGAFPQAGLVQGTDGNFYGTTQYGGINNCYIGCGTVFKITPIGRLTTLHSFCPLGGDCTDGSNPVAGLVQGTDGNFYGTTANGGPNTCYDQSHERSVSCGTVFKITPTGALTTLHSFDSTDGGIPSAGLVQATDGNFYGTTLYGGAKGANDGTIFKITPSGKLTTLYSFCSQSDCTDGSQSYASLVQDTSGIFYGTTASGGLGDGTVFSLSVGLGPFVSFRPAGRPVGDVVEILGQGFTGTTGVSFNGTPATFTVQSDTYLTATVPAGASTGFVTVATDSGTLKSDKKFRVTPQILSFSPTSGPVGTKVVITGTSFTGATGVELACKWPMSFTVDSDTQITAIVPADGTTGELMVLGTPGGHVESTAQFTVTP